MLGYTGLAQADLDNQKFELNTDDLTEFHLYNMNGNVEVIGVDGNKASVEIERKLSSSNSRALEEARSEMFFDVIVEEGAVYYFMESPEYQFKINDEGRGYYKSRNDFYESKRFNIKYNFDIKLKVPKNLKLSVATHWEDISVEGIDGDVYVRNHHGKLSATNLGGDAELKNHHGDVSANFTKAPASKSLFATHHGDISITFPETLSARAFLSSYHGNYYSDFDWAPMALQVKNSGKGGTTKYEIGNETGVQIGQGDAELRFKTWHGDVFLRKN